jgi:hypothetical protein
MGPEVSPNFGDDAPSRGYLFPGGDPMLPMSTRQFNRAVAAGKLV